MKGRGWRVEEEEGERERLESGGGIEGERERLESGGIERVRGRGWRVEEE